MEEAKFSWPAIGMAALCLLVIGAGVSVVVAIGHLVGGQSDPSASSGNRLNHFAKTVALAEAELTPSESIFSPMGRIDSSELSRAALQGVQQAAHASGLSVSELKPSLLPGDSPKTRLLQWEMKVEGQSRQISGFFRRLPKNIPGVEMKQLQVRSWGRDRVECLLRVRLAEEQ